MLALEGAQRRIQAGIGIAGRAIGPIEVEEAQPVEHELRPCHVAAPAGAAAADLLSKVSRSWPPPSRGSGSQHRQRRRQPSMTSLSSSRRVARPMGGNAGSPSAMTPRIGWARLIEITPRFMNPS